MRHNKILAALWVAIALILTAVLAGGLARQGNRGGSIKRLSDWNGIDDDWLDSDDDFSDDDGTPLSGEAFAPEGIKGVEVDLNSLAVEITESTDGLFHVDFTSGAKRRCSIRNSGGRLRISEKKQRFPNVTSMLGGAVLIRIPSRYNGTVGVDSVSGAAKASGLSLGSLDIESVSGSASITDCKISVLDVETVSGSIRADGDFGRLDVESVSGSIKITARSPLKGESSVESVSGSVALKMPADSGYTLRWSTVSGSFNDEITGAGGGKRGTSTNADGSARISVETMSGAIKVSATD